MNRPIRTTALACFALLSVLSSVAPVAQAQTLERIQDTGTLRIGYRADARPFSYQDNGQAAGFSVDLCQLMARDIQQHLGVGGIDVQEVLVTSDERFEAIVDGRIDILCGAATVTLSRREQVAFSMPVFLSGMGAMVRADADSDLKALLLGQEPRFRPRWRASYAQILKRRVIAVIEGSVGEGWLDDEIERFNSPAHVIPYDNYDVAIENLANARADVIFGDRAVLLKVLENAEPGDFEVIDRQYTYEAISMAIPRGDDEFQLVLDRTLSRLYRTGEIVPIYEQYFGEVDETARSLFTRAALPE